MKVMSSVERFKSRVFTITEDVAVDADGFEIRRAIIRHPGSAVVMPMDEGGRVLLVRQFRLPARRKMWELCAGRIDAGETALQAAKRELREETGLRARHWKKLASYFPSPGFLEEKMNVFLATGLTAGDAQWMDDERIETKWFAVTEIDEQIRRGGVQDGKTLIGFLTWQRYHR